MVGVEVVGTVDDPQVLGSAHLEPGLRRLGSGRVEVERGLDDHALAARCGYLRPPCGRRGALLWGVEARVGATGGAEQRPVGADKAVRNVHVPGVLALFKGRALGSEHLEHRQLHAFQAVYRPAIAPVGVHKALRVGIPVRDAVAQRADVHAPPCCPVECGQRHWHRRTRRRAHLGILSAQQPLGLGAPRQQFGVEREPIGVELIEEAGALGCGGDAPHQLHPQLAREEFATGPGIDHARALPPLGEATPRRLLVACYHHDRARSHVLLFAHHALDLVLAERGERLGRVFQHPIDGRRFHRRHRRRQVDQPRRRDRKTAHDLERWRGIFGAHRNPPGEGRLDA